MNSLETNLIDFFWHQSWQILILTLAVALGFRSLRKTSAHWRYLLGFIVLLKCIFPSFVNVPLGDWNTPPSQWVVAQAKNSSPPVPLETPRASFGTPQFIKFKSETSSQISTSGFYWRQWVLLVWGAGAAGSLGVFIINAISIQRRLRQNRSEPNLNLECEYVGLLKTMRVIARPKLCLIESINQPFVWGLWRGCIYVPSQFGTQGDERQRRLVLAHELAHILRWDAAMNAIQIIVQSLFWFHPAVWWLNKRIRHEREKCCDEIAIAMAGSTAHDYGSAIVDRLTKYFDPIVPRSALAISGHARELEDRISTILRPGRRFNRRPSHVAIAAMGVLALLLLPVRLTSSTQATEHRLESSSAHLDLSSVHNASLETAWISDSSDNHLKAIEKQVQTLGGVSFNVSGIVQLSGSNLPQGKFPSTTGTISVNRNFSLLHLLHGTHGRETDGTTIATIILHYVGGQQHRIPIHYGIQLRDWWFQEFEPVRDLQSSMAWTGNNPSAASQSAALRLYRSTLKNPYPDQTISFIQYASAMSQSAPFLIAATTQ